MITFDPKCHYSVDFSPAACQQFVLFSFTGGPQLSNVMLNSFNAEQLTYPHLTLSFSCIGIRLLVVSQFCLASRF